jgi:Spy/CpxP family protein refolding chaperone
MTFTGRTGTFLLVALIVSLCVNLLLAGMMIGGRWHDGPRHRWMGDVPEQARPVMKQVFDAHRPEFDARRDAIRQSRMKLADVLKAEPIDQAQLDQAMDDYLQKSMAMRQFGMQVMVEIAQKLPPEVRREMADEWAKDHFGRRRDPN